MEYSRVSSPLSRREAIQILNYMREIINNYGFVTLADLYDLAGGEISHYADNFKGWRSLTKTKVKWSFRKGHKIVLPPLEDIPADLYL